MLRMNKIAKSGKRGGRKVGVPNRVTADVRRAFADLAERNADHVHAWLNEVAEQSPAKAIELFLQIAEFCIPKIKASEIDIRSSAGDVRHLSYAELEVRIAAS
jgi:hypothetical protein